MIAAMRPAIRKLTAVAITLHVTAIIALAAFGAVSGGTLTDLLRPVPIAALYAAPGVLAALGLQGRRALLLVAVIAMVGLAVRPFSFHSLILAPAAAIYLVAFLTLRGDGHSWPRVVLAAVCFPLLLGGALTVLLVQDHPMCYTELQSGEVIVDRDPGSVTSGRIGPITPDSDVVISGCTSDTVVWWEALSSLSLSAAAVLVGIKLVPSTDGARSAVSTGSDPS